MLRNFLDSLQPDGDSLVSEFSKHVTDDMVAEIALADYPAISWAISLLCEFASVGQSE